MPIASLVPRQSPPADGEPHARQLQQGLLSAQLELATALGRVPEQAFALGDLLRWLGAEYALTRAATVALDAVESRVAAPVVPWVRAQSEALREAARAAADDVRRTSGIVAAPSLEVGQFRDYFDTFAERQPYQVLGAVAVQALAPGGAASSAIAAVLARSVVPHQATAYLALRQAQGQVPALAWWPLWEALPDDGTRRAVLEGVGRGVALHRAVCRATLYGECPAGSWAGHAAGPTP